VMPAKNSASVISVQSVPIRSNRFPLWENLHGKTA